MRTAQNQHDIEADLTVDLAHGIHARPAARISQTARKFSSEIHIISDDGEVDAKSMLDILSLALTPNARIRVIAKGHDAADAVKALIPLFSGTEQWAGRK